MNNRQDLTKYGIVALAALAILGWVREPERHGSVETPVVTPARHVIVPEDETATPEVDHEQQPHTEEPAMPAEPVTIRPRPRKVPVQAPAHAPVNRPVKTIPVTKAGNDPVAPPVTAPTPQQENGRHGAVEEARTRPEPRTERQPEPEPIREATVVRPSRSASSVSLPRQDQRSKRRSTVIIAGAGAAGAAIGAAAGGGKGAIIGAITGAAGGYVYDRMSRGSYRNSGGSGQPTDNTTDSSDRHDFATRFGTPAFN
jgi:hypothetical protein